MKCFLFVLLVNFLLADGWKLSKWENDKENLPLDLSEVSKTCNSNNDCGEDSCCFFWTKQCYPKPAEEEACSPEKAICSCRPGLECKKHKEYDGQKFYRCSRPDIKNIA